MIISNNSSGIDISIRYNEYLDQYIADAIIDGKCKSFPIRAGDSYHAFGIRVKVAGINCCDRQPCDTRPDTVTVNFS